jgi:hypothetical protein
MINARISIPPEEAPIRNKIPTPIPNTIAPIKRSRSTEFRGSDTRGVRESIVIDVMETQNNVQNTLLFPSHLAADSNRLAFRTHKVTE